jgi:flagellar hook-associated protein 1 FlgK
MSGFNLLNIGSQALMANRTALSTVSQNIANASTEGYSRQTANFVSIVDRQGAYIQDVDRATDQFITRQYWSDISNYKSLNLSDTLISQTDNLLASSTTSISASLDTYFKAMQNAVDDPTSLANRELYIEETDALARRFNTLSANLKVQNDSVNAAMEASAGNLSEYSTSIAALNDQIGYLIGRDQPVNELRDQRDVLVKRIAEIVDVNVVEQGESYNLFIGNGQPLVVGQTVNQVELRVGSPDITQSQVFIKMSGSEIDISQQVTGGVLGGAKAFRNEVLTPSLNELGRIALALADETNTQHRKGMDLNNELGGDVFSDINSSVAMRSRIKSDQGNLSTINSTFVNIEDVSKLTLDDYELIVNDNDQLLVKRQPSGEVANLTKVAAIPAAGLADNTYFLDNLTGKMNAKLDGMHIEVQSNSYFSLGDSFLVQPTRFAAEAISSVMTDPKQVALASPVRITTNPNNSGSGVATVEITAPDNLTFGQIASTGQLSPPIEVVFNNAIPMQYSIFDISNPLDPQPISLGTPAVLQQNQVFTVGQTFAVEGYDVKIDGLPKAGDRFSFDFNKDGVSDNRNALALSDIQSKTLLINGSLQDHYAGIIEEIGAKAAAGKINLIASESVMKSTENTLASIIGVNLDEEAAQLVQFQQAYSASARVISTSQLLFSTLLESF